jgi:hypothetical protein
MNIVISHSSDSVLYVTKYIKLCQRWGGNTNNIVYIMTTSGSTSTPGNLPKADYFEV